MNQPTQQWLCHIILKLSSSLAKMSWRSSERGSSSRQAKTLCHWEETPEASWGPPLIFNPHEELFFFLRKQMKLLLEWRRDAFVLLHTLSSSSCPLSDHWECFYMNSEKTATSQSCYSVSLSSVFLICTDYIQPCILLLFFFNYKALVMASGHFYLTVKFDISTTIMSETGVRCIWSA